MQTDVVASASETRQARRKFFRARQRPRAGEESTEGLHCLQNRPSRRCHEDRACLGRSSLEAQNSSGNLDCAGSYLDMRDFFQEDILSFRWTKSELLYGRISKVLFAGDEEDASEQTSPRSSGRRRVATIVRMPPRRGEVRNFTPSY